MILSQPLMQFGQLVSGVFVPLSLADAYFYLAGTTTPSPVYSDVDHSVSLGTSVSADANGVFPALYADPDVPLRMIVVENGDNPLTDAVYDVDYVNRTLTITAGMIEDDAIETKLGYMPVGPAENITITGKWRLQFDQTTLSGDEVGFLGKPLAIHNANYTVRPQDCGKVMTKDDTGSYTWIVPLIATQNIPIGFECEIYNGNTTTIALNRETAGVTLRLAGDATFASADRTIAVGSHYKLRKYATEGWVLTLLA